MLWAVMSSICGFSGASGGSRTGNHYLLTEWVILKFIVRQPKLVPLCTKRILGNERFGDAGWASAILVLRHNPKNIFLLLDEFWHKVSASAQHGGDSAPANLQL